MKRIIAAILAVAVFMPGHARAAEPVPTVELIGYHSGFAKARTDRTSITVGVVPEFGAMSLEDRVAWLDPALDAWNTAADWWLFAPVTDDAAADVTFVPDAHKACPWWAGACVTWDTFPNGWYLHCTIHIYDFLGYVRTVMHELGHCLGFQDVAEPVDGGYAGIMAYGRAPDQTPVNDHDIASLVAAGYRDAP